ncbi:MAG TPA: hypothetical protein VN193_04370 [Candidatus Angelobacter sp.]|jgi:hypothetical protein|nr:hypothetical protein [Candidatus Angelobacter sp.]
MEFFLLGTAVVAIVAAATTLVGGYLAVTYDQHHSTTALGSTTPTETQTPSPPSVVFVDYSPVGLYESCIVGAAAKAGLSWDGGELGWTAGSLPRPLHSDPLYDVKVRDWRNKMTGLLASVSGSADWQACLKPQLTPPPARSQEPTETVSVDGTYTVDPASRQAIGGCGSDPGPTSMTVSSNASTITVIFQTRSATVHGTLDTSANTVQATSTDSDGTKHDVQGSFSSNAGVTRFTGTYDVIKDPAGCGYQFTAQKN